MARENVCTLRRKEAISSIDGTEEVYFRHGIWNEWRLRKTEDVKKSIENSGYGADVFKENGMMYVSIPCQSDMW
jgi:hypothetical protein